MYQIKELTFASRIVQQKPKHKHLTLYKICEVQAEGVQYRLRRTRNTAEDAVRSESVQYRLRHTHSTGTKSFPQPLLHSLMISPYCPPSVCTACTAHPQPVLPTLSLYCPSSACTAHHQPVLPPSACTAHHQPVLPPSACTAHPQPLLPTLGLYSPPSACPAHPQPVLPTLSLYCTPSACTAHHHPVLPTISLYCTPQPVLRVYLSLYCSSRNWLASVNRPA